MGGCCQAHQLEIQIRLVNGRPRFSGSVVIPCSLVPVREPSANRFPRQQDPLDTDHWHNLGTIEPSRAVKHPVIRHIKEIDAEYRETFADPIVSILEFHLHDGGVYLNKDYSCQSSKHHFTPAPLVRNVSSCDAVGHKSQSSIYPSERQHHVRAYTQRLEEDGLKVLQDVHSLEQQDQYAILPNGMLEL